MVLIFVSIVYSITGVKAFSRSFNSKAEKTSAAIKFTLDRTCKLPAKNKKPLQDLSDLQAAVFERLLVFASHRFIGLQNLDRYTHMHM